MKNYEKYKKIGVGVSGGVDSMVLLHKLLRLNFDILVINVEHGIRGESSQKDTLFVKEYCLRNNIPFVGYSFDAVALAEQESISVELAARKGRYIFFEKAIKDFSLDSIALAHHLDDQTETVLMRIFRGTGIKGLKGIVDRKGFIHPLLDETKDEIVAYATKYNINYVVDETNHDSLYTRNFIRNEILPKIKERYSNVEKAIYKLTQNASETDDCLNALACEVISKEDGFLPEELFKKHPAVIKQGIVNLFNKLDIFTDIERVNLEDIIKLNELQTGKSISLPHGFIARKTYDGIIIYQPNELSSINIPFNKSLNFIFNNQRISFNKISKIKNGISFDINKIPDGAVIRTRQNGDIFKRYKGKTKKLNDFLTDVKIPLIQRDKILLIAKDNIILCILGYEISDYIAVDNNTKEIYEYHAENINA